MLFRSAPYRYIRLDGQILLNPKPQSGGKLRVNYIHVIDELDLRRGTISAAPTYSTTSNWNISITNSDPTSLEEHDYICIVNKKGRVIARNIELISATASQLTLGPYTPDTFDSTIDTNHYVVGGLNTSTHGSFDNSVERYLIAYCAWKILKRDSSIDSTEASTEINMMARDIVASYGMVNDDLQLIPQLNDFDDWSY